MLLQPKKIHSSRYRRKKCQVGDQSHFADKGQGFFHVAYCLARVTEQQINLQLAPAVTGFLQVAYRVFHLFPFYFTITLAQYFRRQRFKTQAQGFKAGRIENSRCFFINFPSMQTVWRVKLDLGRQLLRQPRKNCLKAFFFINEQGIIKNDKVLGMKFLLVPENLGQYFFFLPFLENRV